MTNSTIPEATLPLASLPMSSADDVRLIQGGESVRSPASTLPISDSVAAVLGTKAANSLLIIGAGLATGGGALTGNITITVPKASGAEAAAGSDDTKAVTPLALATPLGTINASISALNIQVATKAPINNSVFTGTMTLAQDPVSPLQASTKQYVDSVAQGLNTKPAVLVASTANLTLSGEQTIDGVLTSASRVLVKNQTAPAQNGLYLTASGAWSRTLDMNTWAQVPSAFVFVQEGTINGDTGWTCLADPGGTLGTTAITWAQFSGAGSYTAGTGLVLVGSQFALTGQALALNNVTTAANKLIYATGSAAFATCDFTAVARTLVGQTTTSAMLTAGLGFSANGASLVTAADYTAMKVLLAITPADLSGLGTGVAAWLVTPSSANLRAALTDETGTGAAVFGTGPTITAANIDLAADPTTALAAATKQYVDATATTTTTGTWNPSVTYGGAASPGQTYNSRSGTYTKTGKWVTVQWYIDLLNKGSGTGAARIAGLPFLYNGAINQPFPIYMQNPLLTYAQNTAGQIYACLDGSPEHCSIYDGATFAAITDATIGNATKLVCTMTYITT